MKYITSLLIILTFCLFPYIAEAQFYSPGYVRLPGFNATSCATGEVPEKQSNGTWACGSGGGGGSQTPWTSNIDGGGFDLTGVNLIDADDIFTATSELDLGLLNVGTVRLTAGHNTTRQNYAWGWSNSNSNPNTFEAGFFYDGTDTVNLGSAAGTADANLEVLGLTTGDTITGSWDLPDGEDLLKIVDDTSGDGLFIESKSANGAAFSVGLTQDDGATFAPSFYFWSGGIIFRPSGILNSTYFSGADISLRDSGQYKFSANNDATASADTGVCRNAAGVAMISDGSGCVAGTDEADLLVDEISLTDQGTKGTCDSSKAGTIAYEVVTNVGTFYGCRQTAASTYAWTALH
jgi:hypothetical protein